MSSDRMPADQFARVLGSVRTGGVANTRSDAPLTDPRTVRRDANTALHYRYRDANNFKVGADIVLSGGYSDADLDLIAAKLDDGEFFIPSQVGLDDLQADMPGNENGVDLFDPEGPDHVWHELDLADVRSTDAAPTEHQSWASLVECFTDVQWVVDPGAV